MHKMKQYVSRNLCENFRQIGQKMKKLYLIQVEQLDVIACSHIGPAVPQAREGRGWGNGPMY